MIAVDIAETGTRIKTLRKARGIKRAELSRRIGADTTTIYNWEIGRNIPTSDKLLNLAIEYGMTMEEILVYKEI